MPTSEKRDELSLLMLFVSPKLRSERTNEEALGSVAECMFLSSPARVRAVDVNVNLFLSLPSARSPRAFLWTGYPVVAIRERASWFRDEYGPVAMRFVVRAHAQICAYLVGEVWSSLSSPAADL